MFWVLAQTFPLVLLKPILPGVKFSIYWNSAFTSLFTFCFICSFVFPESVMKQPPQRDQCNVCHELIMPWHLLDNSQDEAFQRYSDKSWTKQLTSEYLLLCSPSKITAPMRLDTSTLTKYHGNCKCSGDNIDRRWSNRNTLCLQWNIGMHT